MARTADTTRTADITRSYPVRALSMTPLIYLRTNELSGDLVDSSGNGLNLTPFGTGSYGNPSPLAGGGAKSVFFNNNGSTSFFIADSATISLAGSQTFTCWMKRDILTAGTYVLASRGNLSGGTDNLAISFFISSTHAPSIRVSGNGTSIVAASSASVINDQNWHHVACVYNQEKLYIRLYVDGLRTGNTTASVPAALYDTPAPLRFGSGSQSSGAANAPGAPFSGYLSEFGYYARALDDWDIGILFGTNAGVSRIADTTRIADAA